MKFAQRTGNHGINPSLPVRGAWVEIGKITGGTLTLAGRSPCGERGLK